MLSAISSAEIAAAHCEVVVIVSNPTASQLVASVTNSKSETERYVGGVVGSKVGENVGSSVTIWQKRKLEPQLLSGVAELESSQSFES